MGWKNQGLVDPKFGGLQVELLSTSILPPLWEALASGRKIQADDPNREMLATVWTIYPPLDCREALGYSK
jgi:hypothetical protein